MSKFVVYTRYQVRKREGIDWSTWFKSIMTPIFDSEKEAKAFIKKLKADTKDIDRVTKLKHEFKIETIDE